MINIVVLVGRAGKDAESKSTPSGKTVSSFSLATDSGFGDKKKTEWSDIVAWDKLGENVAKFVKKGSLLCVVGRKETRSWEGQDGKKQYRTEIIAMEVQKVDTRDGSGSGSAPTQSRQAAPVAKAAPVPQATAAPGAFTGFDDDDPF